MSVVLTALITSGCEQGFVSKNTPGDFGIGLKPPEDLAVADESIQATQILVPATVTPLIDGDSAFDIWLNTLAAAKRTIDIKTFIFSNDKAGERVAAELLKAADRGVKVRLLVDDFFHYWGNSDLSMLDQHNLIEVKIFNPFNRLFPPPFNFLLEFNRVNARMHSKVVVVDGKTAIIGGRNAGDEYFLLNEEEYFADFDMVVTGPAVREFAATFVSFWQDRFSFRYAKFAKAKNSLGLISNENALNSTRFERNVRQLHGQRTVRGKSIKTLPRFRVTAVTRVDAPSKLRARARDRKYVVANSVLQSIANANSSVLIVTPYFIPEVYGADLLESLARRGVKVQVFTNSLGSTNHPSAHAGYLRYRSRLLKAGVKIYEYRENLAAKFHDGQTWRHPRITLHTKLTVIDDRYTVAGSLNFDPRSIRKNSELALLLNGPELAKWLKQRVKRSIQSSAYEVRLNKDTGLNWAYKSGDNWTIRKSEPVGSLVNGAVSALFSILPLDSQL